MRLAGWAMREVGRPEAARRDGGVRLGRWAMGMGAMRPMPMGMGACGWDWERVRVGLGKSGG